MGHLLAAPDAPLAPDVPDAPEAPVAPEVPDAPDVPDAPLMHCEIVSIPKPAGKVMFSSGEVLTSTITGICSVLFDPVAPDVPDAPVAPVAPFDGVSEMVPEHIPDCMPAGLTLTVRTAGVLTPAPVAPDAPVVPVAPDAPEVPLAPDAPGAPEAVTLSQPVGQFEVLVVNVETVNVEAEFWLDVILTICADGVAWLT